MWVFSSVAQSCPTLCDPMNCSTPGLPVHHQLPEFTQIHVHWVRDAIQPSHPLSSLLLLPQIPPSIRVFSNEWVLRIRWLKNGSFGFSISPSNEYSGLISFRMDWCWSLNSNILATWWEELTHWKRPWCWERLKAGGRGWQRMRGGCMASWTQWTWVWVNSRSWWWTERPGILQSMESQRVGHNWETELKWTDTSISTLNVHGLNALIRRYRVAEWMKRQNIHIWCLQDAHYAVYKTLTVLPMGH